MSYQQYSNPGFGGMQMPYPAPTPAPMPVQQSSITRVSGMHGANAFNMGPNSEGLFLDSTQPAVWLKTTDGAGYPTLTGYHLVPMTSDEMEPQQPQVKQIEARDEILQRLDRLERMLTDVSAATIPATESKYTKSGNGSGFKSDQKHDRND